MRDELPVVILGAGVCGLYAARSLSARGIPVVVLEKDASPGGLAAGFVRNGNHYDLGVHHLHGFDHGILADLQALIGGRLKPVELEALIRYGNGFRRYPLQLCDLVTGIPPWRLWSAISGLLSQRIRQRFDTSPAAHAEEALVRMYGRPLYECFFREFTQTYWGFPARELSAAFVRAKMPRLSAVDVIGRTQRRIGFPFRAAPSAGGALTRETLWYPETGSREFPLALCEAIGRQGGEVRLSCPVLRIDTTGKRVTAVRYLQNGGVRIQPCAHCLSTIPLPDLLHAMQPDVPPPILDAGRRLQYRAIAIFGLLLSKPKVLDALYVHFRNRSFHRLAEPKNSGLRVHPEGATVLIAEMTCEVGDDRWHGGEATKTRLLDELQQEGLVAREDVMEIHPFAVRHAYPVFRLGFEESLHTVMQHIRHFENLQSVGRQGGFCYPNMHTAMRMGADAAEVIFRACDSRHITETGEPPATS